VRLERQRMVMEKQQAVEKERTRIATDMHDDLGAGLSRIKFLSETIGIKKQKHQSIEEDIDKIRQYSNDMIHHLGEIVWALNQKNDSLSHLLSYLRSYATEYLSQAGLAARVTAPEEFPSGFVDGEFRRNIFLCVKEILHNVSKHAEATTVWIDLSTGPELKIHIRDDGKGFEPIGTSFTGNGLANLKQRMKDLGGTLELSSSGTGTSVVLSAPLPS
ncbi:MAG: histidine kinase, partial [Bacteroidota bacterium]|nr:histidine kinase [Bacteroidota bacterium]